MEALDIEIAAEYLVIAATLVYLKSKSLLPPIPTEFLAEGEETPEEVEERLRRRLVAYSKCKGVSPRSSARVATRRRHTSSAAVALSLLQNAAKMADRYPPARVLRRLESRTGY